MRCKDLELAAGLRDAMQLRDESDHIRHVLNYMAADNLFKLIVTERIRKDTEIVEDISMTARIRIDADRAGKLVLSAADVQNSFGGFGHAL